MYLPKVNCAHSTLMRCYFNRTRVTKGVSVIEIHIKKLPQLAMTSRTSINLYGREVTDGDIF